MSFDLKDSEEKLPIYGKWAVLSFCVFFSPIFGGILLRQNLIEAGKKTLGNLILFTSIGFACGTAILATTVLRGPGTTFLANLIAGAILVEYVFRNHFVDEDNYPKKSLRKPLIISLIVVTLMLLLIVLTGIPPEAL